MAGVTKPGSVCRESVIGVDFYPTLLEATKTSAPKDYLLDGLSLVPLLENPKAKLKRQAIYWHFPAYLQGYTARHGNFRTTPAGAVRMGDWKLIEFFEDGTLELYDTSKDLSETKNLAKKMPEKARELHEAMLAWRKRPKPPSRPNRTPPTTPSPSRKARPGKRVANRPHELVGETDRDRSGYAGRARRRLGRSRSRSPLRQGRSYSSKRAEGPHSVPRLFFFPAPPRWRRRMVGFLPGRLGPPSRSWTAWA